MHIHDASGHKNHLKLGDGDVDLMKYLDLAKSHECRVVLEIKTVDGLRQSVYWLKERGVIPDEVKAIADFICDDCDEDGAAKWLEVNVL